MTTHARRHGFTLFETAAVIGMLSLLIGVTAPAVKQARVGMRGSVSAANLAFIGQGTGMYAADHQGRLFSYTWAPGVAYTMPNGLLKSGNTSTSAAQWQNTEILMRRTGRIDGVDVIRNMSSQLPHRRFTHLVLMDYLDQPFPSAMWADPADANLLQWQANPTDISSANNIPYTVSSASLQGYDFSPGWLGVDVLQRWAFGSSYLRTVSAWNPDGIGGTPAYVPVASSPNLMSSIGNFDVSLGRNFSEVAFPSAKVHMFEEFDRRQAGSPYFGYDHAAPLKVMFDGSINDRPSGEAGPSWNSAMGKQEWRQTYIPLHTFPIPLSGLGETTPLSQRYRWTVGGLQGIDYGAPLMGR